jgi:metal-responsive CopG/Arc/MetJ family transcriptional regulator
MGVISFSIDEQIKADVERMAQEENRSKSDLFREMYNAYRFKKTLAKVQKVGREKFLALGIESIDQAEAFLG